MTGTPPTAPFWWQAFATGIITEKAGADVLLRAVREGLAAVDETFMGTPSIVMVLDDALLSWRTTPDAEVGDAIKAMQAGKAVSALPRHELERLVPYVRSQIAMEMLAAGADPMVNWADVVNDTRRDPARAPGVSHTLRIPQGLCANPIACAFQHSASLVLHEMLHRCPEAAKALDSLTWFGQPWLHAAARRDASVVQALVGAGANPNLMSKDGRPPLFDAHSPAVVEVLLAAGADPSLNSSAGVSLLAWWRQNNTRDQAAALERVLPATARRAPLEESILTGRFSGSLVSAQDRVAGPRTARELTIAACAMQAWSRNQHRRPTMPKKFVEQMQSALHLSFSEQERATALAWTLNETAGLLRADTSGFRATLDTSMQVPDGLEAALPGVAWKQTGETVERSREDSWTQRSMAMCRAMLQDVMNASPDVSGLPAALAWLCETVERLAPQRQNDERPEVRWLASGPLTILPLLANGADAWPSLAALRKRVPAALADAARNWFRAPIAQNFAGTSREYLGQPMVMQRFRHFFERLGPEDTVEVLDAIASAVSAPSASEEDMAGARGILPALLSQRRGWSDAEWTRFDALCQAPERLAPLAGAKEPKRSEAKAMLQAAVQMLQADHARHRLAAPDAPPRQRFRA